MVTEEVVVMTAEVAVVVVTKGVTAAVEVTVEVAVVDVAVVTVAIAEIDSPRTKKRPRRYSTSS